MFDRKLTTRKINWIIVLCITDMVDPRTKAGASLLDALGLVQRRTVTPSKFISLQYELVIQFADLMNDLLMMEIVQEN